ncbi:MAG: hypothetical protein IH947_06375 [Bacteroidetes bacterium]|nr:hypothetical protein [Bacteroidota bacterium]
MKKIGLVIIVLLSATCYAIAQDYLFKVIISKGDNSYYISSETNWTMLKAGSRLHTGDVLKVAAKGYVALLGSSGETMELKNEDTKEYKIDELTAQLKNTEAGLIDKYASYLVSKMAPEARESNRKAYASITGAVEREVVTIHAYLRKSSVLYDTMAFIRWKPVEDAAEYNVVVRNLYDEIILETKTRKPIISLNFSDEKLKDRDMVIISISTNGGGSNDYSITKVTRDRPGAFVDEIGELRAALDSGSAFDNLVLAEFYEQNNLLLDATTCYEKAMVIEPDVQYFKAIYLEFLMRNNFGNIIN